MDIGKKQLGFFFPIGLLCGMIAMVGYLSPKNCFAIEPSPPFSYYEVIEQRNIFRPKVEEINLSDNQNVSTGPPPELVGSAFDKYVLTGIVKIRGKYKATITNTNTKSGHYVGINELVDNFKIINIQHDTVIFEKDNEVYELKINTPASRVYHKKPVKNEKSSMKNALPEKSLTEDSKTRYRTNAMKSIRMGIPNAQRK